MLASCPELLSCFPCLLTLPGLVGSLTSWVGRWLWGRGPPGWVRSPRSAVLSVAASPRATSIDLSCRVRPAWGVALGACWLCLDLQDLGPNQRGRPTCAMLLLGCVLPPSGPNGHFTSRESCLRSWPDATLHTHRSGRTGVCRCRPRRTLEKAASTAEWASGPRALAFHYSCQITAFCAKHHRGRKKGEEAEGGSKGEPERQVHEKKISELSRQCLPPGPAMAFWPPAKLIIEKGCLTPLLRRVP